MFDTAVLIPCTFNGKQMLNVNLFLSFFVTNWFIFLGLSDLIYTIYGNNPPQR